MSGAQTAGVPAAEVETLSSDDFASLLNREFKPKSDVARDAMSRAVQTLAEQALSSTALISGDALRSIEAMIAAIDAKLTEQVNAIMHHEDFQQLESAWRGLAHLVNNTETDETLKIKVFNISKKDLGRTLKKFRGTAWDQSPIFKKVYEEEYGQFGGEPFGLLVGDYYFDHSPMDVQLLGDMAQVAAGAHAPFLAAASPTVMQMETWDELANPRDLTKIFTTPEYAAWRSLRESEDSRYIGLACRASWRACPTAPRPSRWRSSPSRRTRPARQRQVHLVQRGLRDGHQHHPRVQAVRLDHADPRRRERRRGRGAADAHLPVRRRRRGDEVPDRGRDRRPARGGAGEERLHAADLQEELGLRRLHRRAVPAEAAGIRRSGGHRQRQPGGAPALPVRVCRFAHYLKCMVRDKIGSSMTRAQLENWLQSWLSRYVDSRPRQSSDEWKATHPLAEGTVEVTPTSRTRATTSPSSSSSRTTSSRA